MKQINQSLNCQAIVAMAKNRVIGHQNQLPWHLPADLKRFKALTTGHPIIMGRKTYQSIGKPLPNRMNIILTREIGLQIKDCVVVHTLAQAMNAAATCDSQLFVIGGGDIYQQFLPFITRIFLTIVDYEAVGDTFFPVLNPTEWQEISVEYHDKDTNHAYAYRFVVLEKIMI